MSTSTTDDIGDAVRGLNRFDEASKRCRLIDRLSKQRGQRRVFAAYARVAGSSGGAGGPRRLSMRAYSARRNKDNYYHHPSPPKFRPILATAFSSSGAEAENAAET